MNTLRHQGATLWWLTCHLPPFLFLLLKSLSYVQRWKGESNGKEETLHFHVIFSF